jgi:hypothetical protein
VIALAVALALLSVLTLQFIDRREHPKASSALDNASADR